MSIPETVDDDERLVRVVYSPMNFNEKTGELRDNAFKSPLMKDEVSVLRLEYTNADFCKQHAVRHSDPTKKREYFGMLAVITALAVRTEGADAISTPIKPDLLMHADIVYGYMAESHDNYPPELLYRVQKLKKKSRIFIENDVNTKLWTGDDLSLND
jgi:hypothetical protein